jgi:hypothetical protein
MVMAKGSHAASTYVRFAVRTIRESFPNAIVDRLVHSVAWEELTKQIDNCVLAASELSSRKLQDWAAEYYPDYLATFGDLRHKKLIEFYTTFRILSPCSQHVFMDAAGGANGYLAHLRCRKKILQDKRISTSTREALGPDVQYLEGDAGAIPLPDRSVDCIACHHSFEHFQGDSDTAFIKEVQRLLAVGGRCCIVPLFIVNRYCEITDRISFRLKFDRGSLRIIDPTAVIPGGSGSGNYARAYDVSAFQRRVMQGVDLARFKVSICSLSIDGEVLPDMSLRCHKTTTGLNFPYRALVIDRISE